MYTPTGAVIDITDRCCLKCSMCDRWRMVIDDKKEECGIDTWKRIIDEMVSLKFKSITITGGEPLLYRDINELMLYIIPRFSEIDLISNGECLTDEFVDTFKDKSFTFNLSLDGSREVHNKIRKIPGSFENISYYARRLSHACFVRVNSVIRDENIDSFEDMVDEIKDWAKYVTFQHHAFALKDLKEKSGKQEKEVFGSNQSSLPFLLEEPIAKETIKKIERLDAVISKHSNMRFVPYIKDFNDYYFNSACETPMKICRHVWETMRIKADATVNFCGWLHYTIGDLKTTPIMDVWNSALMSKYRDGILKFDVFNTCKRCCALWNI